MYNLYPGYGVPWFWLHWEIVKGPESSGGGQDIYAKGTTY